MVGIMEMVRMGDCAVLRCLAERPHRISTILHRSSAPTWILQWLIQPISRAVACPTRSS
jgi:hypothetical protein